jgi:Mg/Co/Ni transporter MgtE
VPGKVDWMARGLETEGSNAGKPTAGRLAQRDVATCSVDDTVAQARDRAVKSRGVCVVVNDENVVFGLLRERELGGDGNTRVGEAMKPGPSTFRPHVAIKEMADYFAKHDLASAPVTTSDGRLIGVLFADVAAQAAENAS